jgi:hypothetical protein
MLGSYNDESVFFLHQKLIFVIINFNKIRGLRSVKLILLVGNDSIL